MRSLITRLLFGLILFGILAPLARADHPPIPAGSASNAAQCVEFVVRDTSNTTAWEGLDGLVFNTASLACSYHRNTAAADVALTLATMTAGTWTSEGFVQVDAVSSKGKYQLCLPNAAVAVGADYVTVRCYGATNMEDVNLAVPLLQPNTFGYDGITASEAAGTPVAGRSRYGLASGGIDVDDQFAYVAELALFDAAGLLEGVSCIIDSANTGDTVDLAEDITALTAAGDHYVVRANSACRNLRSTVAGVTLDVTGTGAAGIDWANVEGLTASNNFTNTTIAVCSTVSGAVGSVTGNVGGNVTGNVTGTIGGHTAPALAQFFTLNSTSTYGAAVAGSVVKEIADNASGSGTDVTIHTGTAQSITAGPPAKMRLAASETYGNNVLANQASVLILTSSGATGAVGRAYCVKSNALANDEVTFTESYKVTPAGTVTYAVIPTPNCNVNAWPVSP